MALKDLRSNLSWYGKIAPNDHRIAVQFKETRFAVKNNVPGTAITGFTDNGDFVNFKNMEANNSFQVDSSMSDRGLASREAQQGTGTQFPIGPTGESHEFDIARTGFSTNNKYSDNFGISIKDGFNGLANTYTIDSPIDDMYNKFNIRDDAHNKFNIRQPFIVRGIQREDDSDPQRWGNEVSFNIPRGGVTTMATRVAADLERIGKFLITGKGISFIAKQAGLQLTNPNVEGVTGYPGLLSMGKIYDPLSPLTNAAGAPFGLRTDRNMPPIVRTAIGTYEGVHKARVGDLAKINNRLNKLRIEAFTNQVVTEAGALEKVDSFFSNVSNFTQGLAPDNRSDRRFPGEVYVALTGLTGPGSLLGVGNTTIRRAQVSVGDHTRLDELERKRKGVVDKKTNATTKYTILDFRTGNDNYSIDDSTMEKLMSDENSFKGGTGREGEPIIGSHEGTDKGGSGGEWMTMDYKAIEKAASERQNAGPTDYDFLAEKKFQMEKGVVSDSDSVPLLDKDKDFTYNNDPRGKRTGGGYDTMPNGGTSGNVAAYTKFAYGDIPKQTFAGSSTFNDFRETKKTLPHGASGGGWDTAKIDEIDDDTFGESQNLVPLIFNFPDGSGEDIYFKALLGSIGDSFAPSWNGEQDQGRADSRYLYTGFERTISTDFRVVIFKGEDLGKTYNQLQKLAHGTYPIYAGSGFHGQYCKLTIGNLYKELKVIITDLSYEWDNETPWEIEDGSKVPLYCSVSVSFTVLDDKPDNNVQVYDAATAPPQPPPPPPPPPSPPPAAPPPPPSQKKKSTKKKKKGGSGGSSSSSSSVAPPPPQTLFQKGKEKGWKLIKAVGNFFGFSDRRMKTDIVQLTVSENGIPIYSFRYKDELYGSGRYVGVMAQDLIEKGRADAVYQTESGHYRVDYNAIGLPFYEIEKG